MLLAADGRQTKDIAVELGIGRVQVSRWRDRYAESRRAGIERDPPRGAPPVKVDVARLVELSRRGGHLDERHRVDRGRRIPTTRGLTLGGSDRSTAWYSSAARKVITTTGCIAAITAGRTTTCCRISS